MKKGFKRLLSMLLSICLLSFYSGGMAFAAEEDLSLEIRIESLDSSRDNSGEAVFQGDRIAVTVSLSNHGAENYPAHGLEFTLSFDADRLEAKESEFQNYVRQGWDCDYVEGQGTVRVSYTGDAEVELIDGMDLATLVFQVKEDAEEGDASFSLESTVLDNEGTQISISSMGTSIEVISPDPEAQELALVTLESSSVTVNGSDDVNPIQAFVSDKNGNPVTEHLVWSVEPEDHGVEIDTETGLITIDSNAAEDEYTITAKAAEGQSNLVGEASAKLSVQREIVTYTVTFHANGGTFDNGRETTEIIVEHGQSVAPPFPPDYDGWTFLGWFTTPDGGEELNLSAPITEDTVFFAIWNNEVTEPAPEGITIHFDSNGGTGTMNDITVHSGALCRVPESQFTAPDGYEFSGWVYNLKVYFPGDIVLITSDTVFRAQWTATHGGNNTSPNPGHGGGGGGSAPPAMSFSITVRSVSGGTIIPSTGTAKEGETITITATPDTGYALDTMTVRDGNGNRISLSGSGKIRSFTMPASNVTITASFTLITEPGGVPGQTDQSNNSTLDIEVSPFSDVSTSSSLYSHIKWAHGKNVLRGYADGSFKPQKTVSSITVVVVLARMDNPNMKDAISGKWYSPYENWAVRNNIIPSGVRLENTPFTRGDMARLMVSYLKYRGKNCTPTRTYQFKDADKMTSEQNAAFQYLYGKGIISGTSTLTMSPQGSVTRAQLSKMMHGLYNLR